MRNIFKYMSNREYQIDREKVSQRTKKLKQEHTDYQSNKVNSSLCNSVVIKKNIAAHQSLGKCNKFQSLNTYLIQ